MERFVRSENVKHYRDLLAQAKSHRERQRIQALLDEELKNKRTPGTILPRELTNARVVAGLLRQPILTSAVRDSP